MKKKQFKVSYASEVRNGVSSRTGNNYSLQDVVLVATDEPQTNDACPCFDVKAEL